MLNTSPWKVTEGSAGPCPCLGQEQTENDPLRLLTFINLVGGVCVCVFVRMLYCFNKETWFSFSLGGACVVQWSASGSLGA